MSEYTGNDFGKSMRRNIEKFLSFFVDFPPCFAILNPIQCCPLGIEEIIQFVRSTQNGINQQREEKKIWRK